MERNLLKPFLTIIALMSASIVVLAFAVDVKPEQVHGVVMKLPEELDGGWVGNELRFCHNPDKCAKDYRDASFYVRDLEIPDICPDCGEKLYPMSRAEGEVLPADTEFVKSAYTNNAGERVFASIVLSGRDRDSIHRPQRCLRGQGNNIENEYTLDVPIEGRKPLQVRVIRASRIFNTPDGPMPYRSYYAYWFVGQNRETPFHIMRMFWLAYDRVVHSKAQRWAYIAVSGPREAEGKAYEKTIADFVQKLYPRILTDEMRAKVMKK